MSLDGDDIPDLLEIWEAYVEMYGVIPKGETQKPINKSLQKEEKKMDKIKIYKTHIFVAVYAVLIIIELFFYVPYHSIQVFTSNQNVPHTEIIGSGYATMTDISYDKAYVKNIRSSKTGKRVNTQQVLINISTTTIIAVAIYFLFLNKSEKPIETQISPLDIEEDLTENKGVKVGEIYVNNKNEIYTVAKRDAEKTTLIFKSKNNTTTIRVPNAEADALLIYSGNFE